MICPDLEGSQPLFLLISFLLPLFFSFWNYNNSHIGSFDAILEIILAFFILLIFLSFLSSDWIISKFSYSNSQIISSIVYSAADVLYGIFYFILFFEFVSFQTIYLFCFFGDFFLFVKFLILFIHCFPDLIKFSVCVSL